MNRTARTDLKMLLTEELQITYVQNVLKHFQQIRRFFITRDTAPPVDDFQRDINVGNVLTGREQPSLTLKAILDLYMIQIPLPKT